MESEAAACCFESFKGLTLANTISGPGALVVGTQEGVEAAPRSERDLERAIVCETTRRVTQLCDATVEAERGDEIGLCRSESLARYYPVKCSVKAQRHIWRLSTR